MVCLTVIISISVLINADSSEVEEIEKQSRKKKKDEAKNNLDPHYAMFLGHYVLTRRLLDRMAYNGRIISSAFVGRAYRTPLIEHTGLKLKSVDGFIDSARIKKPKSDLSFFGTQNLPYEDTKFGKKYVAENFRNFLKLSSWTFNLNST